MLYGVLGEEKPALFHAVFFFFFQNFRTLDKAALLTKFGVNKRYIAILNTYKGNPAAVILQFSLFTVESKKCLEIREKKSVQSRVRRQ